jgi:hypothetical protein
MTSEKRSIEVDEETYHRFEEMRAETKTVHMPAMTQKAYLSMLLDTVDAIDKGLYELSDDYD